MNIFQIKIALQGSKKPPIWRVIQVKDKISFWELHLMIQQAMGWYNSHLFAFNLGFASVGIPYDDGFSDDEDAKKTKLKKYFSQEGARMNYTYDFGDSWEHTITLEKVLPVDKKATYPLCIKGKGACPPEDCGGIWGYYDLVEAVNDPKHSEHDDMMEWLGLEEGDKLDPKYFDLEQANRAVKNWQGLDYGL